MGITSSANYIEILEMELSKWKAFHKDHIHSAKDLVFPNLLASFTAVFVQDADVTTSLVEAFSTIGGRVNEAAEVMLPAVPWV